MTDIFFSYRSADRDRVRPIYDALTRRGFEVFWDQQVPGGVDWDSWIRQHLARSKCAIVFWSRASVQSDNVRHEATIAKLQNKLITVLLESLTADQFPMGLYSQQAINLTDWSGDRDHPEWRKLSRDLETKLTPAWLQERVFELEAELLAERARSGGKQNLHNVLQAQIAKEVSVQDELRRERDEIADEKLGLGVKLEALRQERQQAIEASAALKKRINALEHERSVLQKDSMTLSQQLEAARQQIQFDAKHFITAQIEREAKAPRVVNRWLVYPALLVLACTIAIETYLLINTTAPPSANSPVRFTIRRNSVAEGTTLESPPAQTADVCQQLCGDRMSCAAFAYQKSKQTCFLLRTFVGFRSHSDFDSGSRN